MIVGNVGETWDTIKQSEDFLKKTKPDEVGCTGGLRIFPERNFIVMRRNRGLSMMISG